jgi:hypothetical protein
LLRQLLINSADFIVKLRHLIIPENLFKPKGIADDRDHCAIVKEWDHIAQVVHVLESPQ